VQIVRQKSYKIYDFSYLLRAISLVARHLKVGMSETDIYHLLKEALATAKFSNIWGLVLIGPNAGIFIN
jgi:hypothetical protein